MNRNTSALLLTAVYFATAESLAVQYAFTNIADTTSAAPNGTFTGFDFPVISGSTAAFQGTYSGGRGIFTGDGGGLTTIAIEGDIGPFGPFTSVSDPAISGNAVAFLASYGDPGSGVFVGSGGPLTTIAKTGDSPPTGGSFRDLPNAPAISGNTVVFLAEPIGGPKGIFAGSGGPVNTIVKTGDIGPSGIIGNMLDAAISGDTVSFFAGTSGGVGIFTSTHGVLAEVVKTGDPAPDAVFGSILAHTNSGDLVGFNAADSTGTGIFRMRSGEIPTVIARVGDSAPVGTFHGLIAPAIAGNEVVFLGFYGSEESGVFVGSGGPLTTVIRTGDSLFGSTVKSLRLDRFAFDESGTRNIGFHYRLADGRIGVAISIPVPEISTFSLFVFGVIGLFIALPRPHRPIFV